MTCRRWRKEKFCRSCFCRILLIEVTRSFATYCEVIEVLKWRHQNHGNNEYWYKCHVFMQYWRGTQWQNKEWQKITWLIAEVTRHSWSCSYLYAAKLYSFDLYHTWICSSFLYHTKIYLLHNFLFWFSNTLPHFVFKKRCCFTKYAIWILSRGISAILNNTL